jgi:PASTA domain
VSDHVGQPAAEAARAVRRAGLRPGLDRSFGCAAQLTGLVVAQEPASGEQIARNGMVTLYIAAPGAEAEQDVPPGDPERSATDDTVPHAPVAPEIPGADQRRARRKPGRAPGGEKRTFPPPPQPSVRPAHDDSCEAAPAAQTQAERGEDPYPRSAVTSAQETVDAAELPEHEPSYDTSLAEEVFAAGSGAIGARGRIDPGDVRAPSWRAALRWARRRPGFATCACAILAVWLAVALAAGLQGGRPASDGAGTLAQKTPAPETTIVAGQPGPGGPTVIRRRARTALNAVTHAARQRPRATPAHATRPRARATAPSTAAQPEVPPPPSADAPPARSPAAQSGGGPFSP